MNHWRLTLPYNSRRTSQWSLGARKDPRLWMPTFPCNPPRFSAIFQSTCRELRSWISFLFHPPKTSPIFHRRCENVMITIPDIGKIPERFPVGIGGVIASHLLRMIYRSFGRRVNPVWLPILSGICTRPCHFSEH
jgi:hypothetical protein